MVSVGIVVVAVIAPVTLDDEDDALFDWAKASFWFIGIVTPKMDPNAFVVMLVISSSAAAANTHVTPIILVFVFMLSNV